jgi:hypothetical protein
MNGPAQARKLTYGHPIGSPILECPVVWGTPGSLIHFYPKLRHIALNQTRQLLRTISRSDTAAYAKVEAAIVADATMPPQSRS